MPGTSQKIPPGVPLEFIQSDDAEEEKTDPGLAAQKPEIAAPAAVQAPHIPPQAHEPPTPKARPAPRMPDLGPVSSLLRDPEITEIMINDVRNVMVERNGKLQYSGYTYPAIDDLNRIVRNILDITGRILSPDSPTVDVMLPDGSRCHIVGPPLTPQGPCITIRKSPQKRFTIQDLMAFGFLDQRMAYFLNICVLGRMNILLSGGTGTGKTTLLNVLCGFIPRGERIVSIEDTPELVIDHPNSVHMQTKLQTPASPAIGARELLAHSLRMRPDRVIVGECRRAEALDMLQAMNTGHEGSMTTVHSNSPRDALARLETLCLMSGVELPLIAIRKQMVSALDLIIQIRRFRDGSRRIVAITEVTGVEQNTITMQDLFLWESGPQPHFKCTGLVPTFVNRLKAAGYEFPAGFFG